MQNAENEIKNSTKFIFSLVDTEKQIEVPSYAESDSRGKNFVQWGPDNMFPNVLFEMYSNSPSLSAIINGTVEMIKGNDIIINEKIHTLNNDLYYFPYINKERQTVDELVANLVRDYMLYGCFAIQVIYNKLDNKAELYHLPMELVRLNEDRDVIYFNKRWKKYSTNAIEYAAYDPENIIEHKSQVFVYTNSGKRQTYGISPQNSALEDIASECYAAKYIRKTLQNGMAARYIIDLPSTANLTDDDKAEIEDGIRDKFTGWQNAGEFALYFNNGNEAMKITKVDMDNSHEVFNGIRTAARENIFVTNHATPNLFGLPTATTGFNDQEYASAYNLYEKMTLIPIKNTIKTAFERIFGINDAITFTSKNNAIDNE